jgi:predicted nucleic acid-binding protein
VRPIVLDASTAILLAKIDLLRPLVSQGEAWMAESAFREATAKEDLDDARMIRQLEGEGLIRRASSKGEGAKIERDFRLDEGESESIAVARGKGAICATDDGPAIRCLKVLGLAFTTAVALLVSMVEGGHVAGELGIELLSKLERFGRYDPRILEDAARRIREAGRGKHGGGP